ncbi:hypothetical protein KFL_001100100 [Klebsormidium nitens]|uniref:Uncharacterized protein n=1 Tax=Klebsormidium nitens TaxID=105231 RepID=A0A1Y1I0U6_KLENI|nr:hypothetical protein KFL_001100100 [Klebsormidium nitens]|eukprot:GAQ82396.1 hypothetical protein KFL_001100100 [Klebsormidium nitens]
MMCMRVRLVEAEKNLNCDDLRRVIRGLLQEETRFVQVKELVKDFGRSSVSSISRHDLQVGTDCLLLDFLTSAWTFSDHCFHLDELWGYAVSPIDFDGASSSIELFLDNARAAIKESADVHPAEAETGRGECEGNQVDDDCVSVSQAASAISEEEMDGDQSFSTGESLPNRSVAFGSDTGAATYDSTELLRKMKRDGEVSATEPKAQTRLSTDLESTDVVDEAQSMKNSSTSRIDQGSTFESVLVDGFPQLREDSGRQSASGSEAVQDSILHPVPETQYEDAESQLDVDLSNEPPKLDSERRATFGSRILPAKRSLFEEISRATCDCSAEEATAGQPAAVRVHESVNDQVELPLEPPVPVEVSSKTKLCFSKGGTPYWLVSFTIQSIGDHWIELQGLCYTRHGDEKPVTIVWPSGDVVLKGERSFVSYAVRFERTSNVPPQMIFQWQYRKLEKKKSAKREGPVKNPRIGSEYKRLPPTQLNSARKSPKRPTNQDHLPVHS